MEVTKGKATTAQLDNLHNVVATVIGDELSRQLEGTKVVIQYDDETEDEIRQLDPVGVDTKLLGQAIAFLKNNNITADVLESDKMRSLADDIKAIANKENDLKEISVEDMLDIAGRAN